MPWLTCIFQSSLLGMERVGLGMSHRSVGTKVGEKWVRIEILTQDTFWKVRLNSQVVKAVLSLM